MMAVKDRTVGVRMNDGLYQAVKESADQSGLTVSEQIRFELAVRRGLWKPPILPGDEHPPMPRRHSPRKG